MARGPKPGLYFMMSLVLTNKFWLEPVRVFFLSTPRLKFEMTSSLSSSSILLRVPIKLPLPCFAILSNIFRLFIFLYRTWSGCVIKRPLTYCPSMLPLTSVNMFSVFLMCSGLIFSSLSTSFGDSPLCFLSYLALNLFRKSSRVV